MKFTDILQEYGVPTAPSGHHHQTHGWVQIDCPFCGKDTKSFHMGYNIRGGFVNCWRCGSHPLAVTLRQLTGLNFKQIKSLIDQMDGIISQPVKQNEARRLQLPNGLTPMMEPHRRYLTSRGFQWDEIERLWQVQGIGIAAGELSWRLFIPITYQGQVVSWTTRAIGSHVQKRYIGAHSDEEAIPKSELLYGFDYVRNTTVITEGPIDVWKIGPGAVATLGMDFSQAQVMQMLKIPRRIICYDNEPEAQKQAMKLLDQLGAFSGDTFNVVLDSKDAGEAKHRELKRLRKFLE